MGFFSFYSFLYPSFSFILVFISKQFLIAVVCVCVCVLRMRVCMHHNTFSEINNIVNRTPPGRGNGAADSLCYVGGWKDAEPDGNVYASRCVCACAYARRGE